MRDLDLEKFFDRVNHDKLMGQVAKRVEDKRLSKVIRAFLNAGVGCERAGQPNTFIWAARSLSSMILITSVMREVDRTGFVVCNLGTTCVASEVSNVISAFSKASSVCYVLHRKVRNPR